MDSVKIAGSNDNQMKTAGHALQEQWVIPVCDAATYECHRMTHIRTRNQAVRSPANSKCGILAGTATNGPQRMRNKRRSPLNSECGILAGTATNGSKVHAPEGSKVHTLVKAYCLTGFSKIAIGIPGHKRRNWRRKRCKRPELCVLWSAWSSEPSQSIEYR